MSTRITCEASGYLLSAPYSFYYYNVTRVFEDSFGDLPLVEIHIDGTLFGQDMYRHQIDFNSRGCIIRMKFPISPPSSPSDVLQSLEAMLKKAVSQYIEMKSET